jgi:uncharacterized protein YdhG (YjbR/CyaY superfamily)
MLYPKVYNGTATNFDNFASPEKGEKRGEPAMSQAIDQYISDQREDIQPILHQVRETLRATLPEAEERISWRMPTYWKDKNIIYFAAFKNHMGIYPGDVAIEHFRDRLSDYRFSKGAIQFPYDQPIPLDLIRDIALWCYETGHHHGSK